MHNRIPLVTLACLVFGLCFSVSAQSPGEGTLNTWTTDPVERLGSPGSSYLRFVRATRQDTFDRVVFNFDGPVPNYSIKYLAAPYYESAAGRERIRIPGSRYVQVTLHIIPTDEKQLAMSEHEGFIAKGRLKMRSLLAVAKKNLFEGYYDFLLGIRARRPFRVTELSSPSRLVIDFKH